MATGVVLVHGAGDTAHVWRHVRAGLDRPSLAVDLPGRAGRPADITAWDADTAALGLGDDIARFTAGPPELDGVVVVAHSIAGVVGLRLAARLGPVVRHLVLVAGVTAPHGELPVDIVQPHRRDELAARRPKLLHRYRGHCLVRATAEIDLPDGLAVLDDPLLAMSIDSMNLMFRPVDWSGVDRGLQRTWVRCSDDAIQTPEMQRRLIEVSGAQHVHDLASGHTPARDAPHELAALIETIAARHDPVGSTR